MAAHPNDEDEGGEDHPSTWPWVLSSMSGFPFPDLTCCSEKRVRRPASAQYPDLLLLPNGRGFYLGRRVVDSLFGAVFHGYKGICRDPQNPLSFVAPEGEDFQVAVKVSSLANMRRTPQENVFREISVMRYLSRGRHPHVMPLVDACITETHVFVMTPFCSGGDLLNWVVPSEGTGERRARRWFRQIFRGVHYIHEMGLCHHDLSPENVVVRRGGEAAVVMDMGMIQRIPTDAEGRVTTLRDPERFGKLRELRAMVHERQAVAPSASTPARPFEDDLIQLMILTAIDLCASNGHRTKCPTLDDMRPELFRVSVLEFNPDFYHNSSVFLAPCDVAWRTRDAGIMLGRRNAYMAPEIYRNEDYDGRKVDLWSLGVTLLVCLAGTYPWEAPTRVPVHARFIYQSDVDRFRDLSDQGAEVMLNRMNLSPPRVSAEALDLVQRILIVDSRHRPFSAADLAEHPFCME